MEENKLNIDEILNADITNIVDFMNIKYLPNLIADFLNSHGYKKIGNLRKFYSILLKYLGEDIKDSYLNRILKYLSSREANTINIIEDINYGVFDKELMEFCTYLVSKINKYEDAYILYETINSKMNIVFFDSDLEKQYNIIKEYHNNKDYINFVYYLLKHAFLNYKISLPNIVSSQLYANASTLNLNEICYMKYLYASSYLGNDEATILLYNTLIRYDKNFAVKTLLAAKDEPRALWMIGFSLENNRLSKETVQLVRERFSYIFEQTDDFIGNIKVTEKSKIKHSENTLMLAYKLYHYCYQKFNYTKAGNSLGKLLIFDSVRYMNDRNKSIEYGKMFLKYEMRRSNINAITNLAIYSYCYSKDDDLSDYDIERILKASASFGDPAGNCYYGKYLLDHGKYEEAFPYLKEASRTNYPHTYVYLGKYYELKNDYVNAIESYKKGIFYKSYDCAYHISLLYYNLKEIQKENASIIDIINKNYLNDYYDYLSPVVKKDAEKLLKQLNKCNEIK